MGQSIGAISVLSLYCILSAFQSGRRGGATRGALGWSDPESVGVPSAGTLAGGG